MVVQAASPAGKELTSPEDNLYPLLHVAAAAGAAAIIDDADAGLLLLLLKWLALAAAACAAATAASATAGAVDVLVEEEVPLTPSAEVLPRTSDPQGPVTPNTTPVPSCAETSLSVSPLFN
jgi:hypothetical protein